MHGTEPRLVGGRYEIGPVLGYGGMAEVYRGRDVRLGREVAVKTLRADLARDPTFHARFRREAQSAAALNHPAIVSVYDTGEDEVAGITVPYIVMEYVEGRTLREVLNAEGRFTEQRALEIASDVCAALDYSHRMGIIHRDIKPANVMLGYDGSVKVMDFGIARATTQTSSMTQTAQVIGTAQYLSPEQAQGETVDARSDVYSTGVLLYELLTGEPPFRGDSPVAVAYQHVREMPQPPSVVDPDISPEADAIVFKAMAKAREDRYQTAGEMRDDSERALAGRQIYAPLLSQGGATQMLAGATQRIAPGGYGDPTASYGGYKDSGYDDYTGGYGPPTGQIGAQRGPGDGDGRPAYWKYAAVIGAVVAVFVIAALLATRALGGGGGGGSGDKTVPDDLVNQNVSAAISELDRAGIGHTVKHVDNDTVGKDLVISTDPAGGSKLAKGEKVLLTVSLGKGDVTVPNLVGLDKDQALAQLSQLGLNGLPQTVPAKPGDTPGRVTRQDPEPDTKVQKGQGVTIFVAGENGELPNVTGQQVTQAVQSLAALGYTNVKQTEVESDQTPGTVVGQTPAAGQLPLSTQITLQVAKARAQPTQTPEPTQTPTTAPPTTAPPTTGPTATSGTGGPGNGGGDNGGGITVPQ